MIRLIILIATFLLTSNVSAQDFSEYGFNVSLPCDLKKQKSLTGEQAASMGFEGIVSWTTFKCTDRSESGEGTLFRVTAINHGSYTGGRDQYASKIQKQHDSKGRSTEIIKYLGGEACMSKSITKIRGSEFKNWSLDFSKGEWSYTLQVLSNDGYVRKRFSKITKGFRFDR